MSVTRKQIAAVLGVLMRLGVLMMGREEMEQEVVLVSKLGVAKRLREKVAWTEDADEVLRARELEEIEMLGDHVLPKAVRRRPRAL